MSFQVHQGAIVWQDIIKIGNAGQTPAKLHALYRYATPNNKKEFQFFKIF